MKNALKIFLLITLFLIILITSVNASGIMMDLEEYTPANSAQGTIIPSTDSANSETEVNKKDNSPKITSTSTNDDEFLTVENIISIIIIVIGILIILLAIAILIRLKAPI